MRSSTALAVLSALCAIAAVAIPEPGVLLARLAALSRRGGWLASSSPASSHPLASDGSTGCPLGFGGSGGTNNAASPSSTAPPLERRAWYVGAGGGWTAAVEEDGQKEGPLWLQPGGGFAVDGAGDVAEVAATEAEASAAVLRDERAGLLAGPPRQLNGAFVLPGFVDPHVHLIPAGLALTSHADLREAKSRDEFEARVASAARRLLRQEREQGGGWDCSSSDGNAPEGLPWLMGGWWDESRWRGSGDGMPTAAWIDAALERAAKDEEEEEDAQAAAAACLRALPALLSRMDGHMAVANRAALRRALLRERERRRGAGEPEGGVAAEGAGELLAATPAILGEAAPSSSQPTTSRFVDAETGLVREAGLLVVARAAPPPTLAARRAALAAAAACLLSRGVTAVGDMGRSPFAGGDPAASWDDLEELYDPAAAAAVAAEGAGAGAGGSSSSNSGATPLPLRLAAYLPLETWPRLAARVAARGAVTGPLHAAGVKCFWDGSLGSRTALMTEPYEEGEEDEAGGGGNGGANTNGKNRGVRMVDSPEEAARAMIGADAAYLQPAVHAIGDAAVDEATRALEAVAEARSKRGADADDNRPPPLRLEHVQHISGDAAAAKLAELAGSGAGGDGPSPAAVAVINPQHLVSDAKLFRALPRAMRAAGAFRTHPWRALLRAGVPLAIGSDWPVVDLDPWAELWAAVHRRAVGERGKDEEDEAASLTAEEALRASTAGAAYAAGLDAWCGRLVPGLKADFVLLDGSPFDDDDDDGGAGIKRLARSRPRVRATFVGGVCRHGCGDEGGDDEKRPRTTTTT